ncbi:hypothetical protein BDW71DRAFT_182243 [Aspergillus fruticulosus]
MSDLSLPYETAFVASIRHQLRILQPPMPSIGAEHDPLPPSGESLPFPLQDIQHDKPVQVGQILDAHVVPYAGPVTHHHRMSDLQHRLHVPGVDANPVEQASAVPIDDGTHDHERLDSQVEARVDDAQLGGPLRVGLCRLERILVGVHVVGQIVELPHPHGVGDGLVADVGCAGCADLPRSCLLGTNAQYTIITARGIQRCLWSVTNFLFSGWKLPA